MVTFSLSLYTLMSLLNHLHRLFQLPLPTSMLIHAQVKNKPPLPQPLQSFNEPAPAALFPSACLALST
jgi:hypothetical protein